MSALSNRYIAVALVAAGILLFAALPPAGAGGSPSRSRSQWDRLSATACDYAGKARDMALHAEDVLVSIDTLDDQARQFVPARTMARELADPLAQVRRDTHDFRSAVRSFETGMRRLCNGRSDGDSLQHAADSFNSLIEEINAAQADFSRTERRLGELHTIFLLRSESLDSIRRIGEEPGFDQ